MSLRYIALLALTVSPSFCADWNAHLAEQYLDGRLKEWAAWPNAVVSGVVCVSCHSGLPYLVARPAFRQALGEKTGPTLYENLLVEARAPRCFEPTPRNCSAASKAILAIRFMRPSP